MVEIVKELFKLIGIEVQMKSFGRIQLCQKQTTVRDGAKKVFSNQLTPERSQRGSL